MSDLRTRIADALKAQAEFRGIYKIADFDYPFLADAVIRELHTWDTLMELLDSVYPTAVFPTLPDDPNRDPGPRIISLLRLINAIRTNTDWKADDE